MNVTAEQVQAALEKLRAPSLGEPCDRAEGLYCSAPHAGPFIAFVSDANHVDEEHTVHICAACLAELVNEAGTDDGMVTVRMTKDDAECMCRMLYRELSDLNNGRWTELSPATVSSLREHVVGLRSLFQSALKDSS